MAVKQPKRRRCAAQDFKKQLGDQARAKSRVNIGAASERWRDLRELKGMKTDEEVALFLLHSYEKISSTSIPLKHELIGPPESLSDRGDDFSQETAIQQLGSRLEAALEAEATGEGGGPPGPKDEACVGGEEAEHGAGAGQGCQDEEEIGVKVEMEDKEGQQHTAPYGQEFVVKVEEKEEPANDCKAQEAVRVKMEDRHVSYGRKRPYAEGHGISCSELREHKRSCLPQPPAKEEEEDFIQKIPVEDRVRGTVGPSSQAEHEQTVAMKTFSLEGDSGEESEASADSMEEDTFLYGENATLDITEDPEPPCATSPCALSAYDKRRHGDPSTETQAGGKWHTVDTADQGPPQFTFHPKRNPGVQLDLQREYSPLDVFQLFFSKTVLATLCQNTNKHARRGCRQLPKHTWQDVDLEEMMRYLGLTIYTGLVRFPEVGDMWRVDGLHRHPFPASVMPCHRFESISSFLHMSDPEADVTNDQLRGTPSYDPLLKLKPLYNDIIESCKTYYHPYQHIAIDGLADTWNGRHMDTSTKGDFKLFMLADSLTGYTVNFCVYQGKGVTPCDKGLAFDAVVSLLPVSFLGTGYRLYVDNFYTSTALFNHLHTLNIGACGPMRADRTGFPEDRPNALPKDVPRGDIRWRREGPLLFVKWKDTREVVMCSSIHKAFGGRVVQRRGKAADGQKQQNVPVPDAVVDYSKFMGDLVDARMKYSCVDKMTKKWYKKLFFHFLDISVANSYVIHENITRAKKQRPLTEKRFREILCEQLVAFGRIDEGTQQAKAAMAPGPSQQPQEEHGCMSRHIPRNTSKSIKLNSCNGRSNMWHSDCLQRQTEMSSGEEYTPGSTSDSEADVDEQAPISEANSKFHSVIDSDRVLCTATDTLDCQIGGSSVVETSGDSVVSRINSTQLENSTTLAKDGRNYCFLCGTPQTKLARHLKRHKRESADVAKALSFPTGSKERKKLLDILRNRGNFMHNNSVLSNGCGSLKVSRRSKDETCRAYEYCIHCRGMFKRVELWRHMRRCPSKLEENNDHKGRNRVLGLAAVAKTSLSRNDTEGALKILKQMKDDEAAGIIGNDLTLLQFAQSLFNKLGHNKARHEYIQQRILVLSRFLKALRKKSPLWTLDDAIRPENFMTVVEAVKEVAGYDANENAFKTPSLVMKIGYSLQKASDIVRCNAIIAEDKNLQKSVEAFQVLYKAKWLEYVSHSVRGTLRKKECSKPKKLHLNEDIEKLHQHLGRSAELAFAALKKEGSVQNYSSLARVSLAQIILLNRHHYGEISKISSKNFLDKDNSHIQQDLGLSECEKKLCGHFTRVALIDKNKHEVAVLLPPEVVTALELLIMRRKECGVPEDNPHLFAVPKCMSHYRGHECLKAYASECGAHHPEHLSSTRLRKQIAATSQILHLKNNEKEQLENYLGHRNCRLPEPTIPMAKISKLLLALERGKIPQLAGRSLDEVEEFTDEEGDNSEEEEDHDASDCHDATTERKDDRKITCKKRASSKNTGSVRQRHRKAWSSTEVEAVMRHFKGHIRKGILASVTECKVCKKAEAVILRNRTVQNIRDFVRNRGLLFKKQNCH